MKSKEKYQESVKKVQELRKQAQELAQEAFKDCSKELFDKYPDLQSFSWRQYTDYFNDGDTYNFHVHCDGWGCYLNDLSVDEINGPTIWKWDENLKKGFNVSVEPHPLFAISEEVFNMVSSFDSEDMKEMFGDHVEVVVSRKDSDIDIQINDYTSHD